LLKNKQGNMENILDYKDEDKLVKLRQRVGMIFQKPIPFPMSIYENIAYGLKIKGIKDKTVLDETVKNALKNVALWDDVKDRLNDSALNLSGGEQQRLCIARAVALNPEVLLMDEPTSALDPHSTHSIEELILGLKNSITIVIVTHNMQQAKRISEYTAFLNQGRVVEYNKTSCFFSNPQNKLSLDYISGRFG